MNDDAYIYVFVRQDISFADQLVQACHAIERMCSCYRIDPDIHPAIVAVDCPTPKAIRKAIRKLAEAGVPHHPYTDPDNQGMGVTAIATVPLRGKERDVPQEYRLYSGGTAQAACGVMPDAGASLCQADVAQLREHSVSNGGVGGENPSVGSNVL